MIMECDWINFFLLEKYIFIIPLPHLGKFKPQENKKISVLMGFFNAGKVFKILSLKLYTGLLFVPCEKVRISPLRMEQRCLVPSWNGENLLFASLTCIQ